LGAHVFSWLRVLKKSGESRNRWDAVKIYTSIIVDVRIVTCPDTSAHGSMASITGPKILFHPGKIQENQWPSHPVLTF
jgi:hypothetical protein